MDSLEGFDALEEQRRVNQRLMTQLRAAKQRSADVVEASLQGAADAYRSIPRRPLKAPKVDRRKGAEVALWHLTDWQGGKVTTSYNSDVMRSRVRQFMAKALHITDIQRADHPVNDCAIAFGGDMLEGLFNFSTQPFEIDATIHEQWVNVSDLLIEVVEFALENYAQVTVCAEWGNHGRIGSKNAVIPRSDNFDRMCYEHARRMVKDHKRLTWPESPEHIQRLEIGEYRALVIHGDEFGRTGFASPTTITQHVNRWRSGAYPWRFRDVYVGHYHNHREDSLADGEGAVYYTGSTESDNRYAREGMSAASKPSQRLHFIDPVRGRVTGQYKIWLD